jgi:hypothetical protein
MMPSHPLREVGMKRELRYFKAIETTDFAGKNAKIAVVGEVQTRSGNEKVALIEGLQGINPKILILDVKVSVSGDGTDVMGWTKAEFHKAISEGQYTEVTIRAEDNAITIKVEKIIS